MEQDPSRAGLCKLAEDRRYGSAWRNAHGTTEDRKILTKWPIRRTRAWLDYVNEPQTEQEEAAIRRDQSKGSATVLIFGNSRFKNIFEFLSGSRLAGAAMVGFFEA